MEDADKTEYVQTIRCQYDFDSYQSRQSSVYDLLNEYERSKADRIYGAAEKAVRRKSI
jgi:hypothetical protein